MDRWVLAVMVDGPGVFGFGVTCLQYHIHADNMLYNYALLSFYVPYVDTPNGNGCLGSKLVKKFANLYFKLHLIRLEIRDTWNAHALHHTPNS